MQVYEISVRFMRRIQVREYEPAEAEVTVKAQLADGEKAESVISDAFKIASGEVHVSLGLAKDTKLPARAKGRTEAEITAAATTKGPDPKPAATTASDIPGEGAPAAKTTAAAASAVSDIPGDDPAPPATATGGESLTPADFSKWIGDQVRNGKVTSQAITGLYPKFGISRFADLKPEKIPEAKAEIEKLIATTGL